MTIQLTVATRIDGSVAAAASQHTLDPAVEADFIYRGIATRVGAAPDVSGVGVPVNAKFNPLTGESTLESAGIAFPHISNARCLDPRKADGVALPRCTVTSGSNIVNCLDGAFTSADVGKYFMIYDMNTANLTLTAKFTGTIIAVNSATQFQASGNAGTTIGTATNGRCFYGTDRSGEIQELLTLAGTRGGYVQMPIGLLACVSNLVVPGNVTLVGYGRDYPSTREFLQRGTALIRCGTYDGANPFVSLGDTANNYSSSKIKAEIRDIGLDAAERNDYVLGSVSSRTRVDNVTIWRGFGQAAKFDSAGDPWIYHSVFGQMNVGNVIVATGDMHLFDSHIRGSGNGGHNINLLAQSDVQISRCHMFKGGVGTTSIATLLGNNIFARATGFGGTKHSNWQFNENVFDGTAGHHIVIQVGATLATSLNAVSIQNNSFFQNVLPDNTYNFLDITMSNSSRLEMNVQGNTGIATLYDTDNNAYANFINVAGTGTVLSNVSGNVISHCLAGCTGFVPTVGANTNFRTSAANAATVF
jgi:hypothetical protein